MLRWQVFGAVALRKLPELLPPMDPIHAKVQDVYNKYENSKSRFSQIEIDSLEETRAKKEDSEIMTKEIIQDKLERWNKEKEEYRYGPYDHRLTLTQYLVVRQNFGSDPKERWLLPQSEYNAKIDENLLDTCRRALKENFGIVNGFKIVSKIPSSVYFYKYPKEIALRTKCLGAKVFFLKAHLDGPDKTVLKALGLTEKQGQGTDIAKGTDNSRPVKWLTRDEIEQLVECNEYFHKFNLGLFHEDQVDIERVYRRAASYAMAVSSTRALV